MELRAPPACTVYYDHLVRLVHLNTVFRGEHLLGIPWVLAVHPRKDLWNTCLHQSQVKVGLRGCIFLEQRIELVGVAGIDIVFREPGPRPPPLASTLQQRGEEGFCICMKCEREKKMELYIYMYLPHNAQYYTLYYLLLLCAPLLLQLLYTSVL